MKQRFHNVRGLSANEAPVAMKYGADKTTPVNTGKMEVGDLVVGQSYNVARYLNGNPVMVGTITDINPRMGTEIDDSVKPERVCLPFGQVVEDCKY